MCRKEFFSKNKKQIMGILNVTPDSFSDGGQFTTLENAVEQAHSLVQDGADMIDIGGQSTRPGYQEVSEEEEKARVLPVISKIRKKMNVMISVDTYFPSVAAAALEAGADIINDVRGLDQPGMLEVIRDYQCGVVIMHSRKRRSDLSLQKDIQQFYQEKVQLCLESNIPANCLCLDPGIGFHKSPEENGEILKNTSAFGYQEFPLLIGLSRKRIIGTICQEKAPEKRDVGSIVASLSALQNGADIVRVHNVKEMKAGLRMWNFLNERKVKS